VIKQKRKHKSIEGQATTPASSTPEQSGKKRRKRRTKLEMIAARAGNTVPTPAPQSTAKTDWTPGEDYDQAESEARNQQNLPARNSNYDKWLNSELAKLDGPWKTKNINGSWSVTNTKGKTLVASLSSENLALAISVIPQIVCTFTSVGNVFAMTELERKYYKEALEGLYSYRFQLSQPAQ
jgi:hypothetical protein